MQVHQAEKRMQGNRCNHDKSKPRLYRAQRTKEINTLVKRVRRFYDRPLSLFKDLRHLDNRKRQVRSERREAVVSVLAVILAHYDYGQDRFGILDQHTGQFRRFGCDFIADRSGLSLPRVWRALSDLRRSGYLFATKKTRKVDGELVHDVAVRWLTARFWSAMNAWGTLETIAAKAKKRNARIVRKLKDKLTKAHEAALRRDYEARTGRPMPKGARSVSAILETLKPA
ncbi:MAG: hypothetical protein KA296_13780 [Marinobacter sp.]|nr:hypothetical protein [Marinobacter sp.]